MRIILVFILSVGLFISCETSKKQSKLIEKLSIGDYKEYIVSGNPSLRGVDVVDDKIVWVSGNNGTYARSIDAGDSWKCGKINSDTLVDFRDIQAFNAESAIVASAGSPAKIYKTSDGGNSWRLVYENCDSSIFINSIDFYDSKNGYAWSDPINNEFFVIRTIDDGETWDTIDVKKLPKPLYKEAGFAASGTSIISNCDGLVILVTGGNKARIIQSCDYGSSWEAIDTPIKVGDSSFGIYSIGAIDDKTFVVAGGSWQKPDEANSNVAISKDGGKNWLLTKSFPSGFRSCIKYLNMAKILLTCGTNGVDISTNLGDSWEKTTLGGYNTLDFSPDEKFLVFAGSNGKIAFFKLNN